MDKEQKACDAQAKLTTWQRTGLLQELVAWLNDKGLDDKEKMVVINDAQSEYP